MTREAANDRVRSKLKGVLFAAVSLALDAIKTEDPADESDIHLAFFVLRAVVIDPDGMTDELRKVLKETLVSGQRRALGQLDGIRKSLLKEINEHSELTGGKPVPDEPGVVHPEEE